MSRPFSIGSIGFAMRMTSKFDIDFEFSETSFLFKSNTKERQISMLSSRYKKIWLEVRLRPKSPFKSWVLYLLLCLQPQVAGNTALFLAPHDSLPFLLHLFVFQN